MEWWSAGAVNNRSWVCGSEGVIDECDGGGVGNFEFVRKRVNVFRKQTRSSGSFARLRRCSSVICGIAVSKGSNHNFPRCH